MEPVSITSSEFNVLQAYVRDTHGATHSHYKVGILHAFRVERWVVFTFCILLSPFSFRGVELSPHLWWIGSKKRLHGSRVGLTPLSKGNVSCFGTARGRRTSLVRERSFGTSCSLSQYVGPNRYPLARVAHRTARRYVSVNPAFFTLGC
jgi:hypothetical protein